MDRISRTHRARELRQSGFLSPDKLWQAVRGRKLDGLKFRREHSVLGYFADFACEQAKLIVELDGLSHEVAGAPARDATREAALEAAGWHVIRFKNRDVLEDLPRVLEEIRRAARTTRGA